MSKICTFFGHRDTPDTIRPVLHETIVKLIEEGKADTFYVGNQGNFDSMVYEELKILKEQYPHIRYAVIFAYKPTEEKYKIKKEYARHKRRCYAKLRKYCQWLRLQYFGY